MMHGTIKLKINTYCFCTVTIVTRTHLNVMLICASFVLLFCTLERGCNLGLKKSYFMLTGLIKQANKGLFNTEIWWPRIQPRFSLD